MFPGTSCGICSTKDLNNYELLSNIFHHYVIISGAFLKAGYKRERCKLTPRSVQRWGKKVETKQEYDSQTNISIHVDHKICLYAPMVELLTTIRAVGLKPLHIIKSVKL